MVQIIGRIYRIVSSECDGVYVGSTTQQLNIRFSEHKSHYRRYLAGKRNYLTSFEVLKFVDAQIELIHEGLFNGKKDMEQFEGDTIRTTPNAVNKAIPGWTGTKQEYDKQYKEANKEARHEHANTKCTCPICGGKYTLASKARHFRSKKHRDAVSSANAFSTGSEQDHTEDDEPL